MQIKAIGARASKECKECRKRDSEHVQRRYKSGHRGLVYWRRVALF